MTSSELRFLSLNGPQAAARGVRGSEEPAPPRLQFALPSGRIRSADLTEQQLLQIIEQATKALQMIARERDRERLLP